ncbi:hypothetical protein Bbad01_19330 [Bacillus badius]|nr:hypothetical protein Bbad01_19330 [Bacillus badius]
MQSFTFSVEAACLLQIDLQQAISNVSDQEIGFGSYTVMYKGNKQGGTKHARLSIRIWTNGKRSGKGLGELSRSGQNYIG